MRGSTANTAITVTSLNGFSGEIRIQYESNPEGLLIVSIPQTMMIAPNQASNSRLNITVPRNLRSGVYYVRITGVINGLTRPAAIAVFVT
jgi:hypothetical protein